MTISVTVNTLIFRVLLGVDSMLEKDSILVIYIITVLFNIGWLTFFVFGLKVFDR